MALKLTPEMRKALQQQPGRPLEVEDEQTHKVYLLLERDQVRETLDRWIVQELEVAETDLAAGRTAPWNPAELLTKAQSRTDRPSLE